jgi:hypothetical protein
MRMDDENFDRRGIDRQLLYWAVATRRQLGRWEPLVAANLRAQRGGPPFSDVLIWQAAHEHHFLLIAARHLITAIEMAQGSQSTEQSERSSRKGGTCMNIGERTLRCSW